MATQRVVHDLDGDLQIPMPSDDVDATLCCVSIDYLTRPVEVLRDRARVLLLGTPLVITFSNRRFSTKAVHGWLATDDDGRAQVVVEYLARAGGFSAAEVSLRRPSSRSCRGDPLHAVVARAT